MRSRPLIFLLTVVFLLTSLFVVPVGAADDYNLLNSQSSWFINSSTTTTVYSGCMRFYVPALNTSPYLYGRWASLDLIDGHNYSVSVKFPNASQLKSLAGLSVTDSDLLSFLNKDGLQVMFGVGYYADGGLKFSAGNIWFCYGKDFSSKLGKVAKFNFEYNRSIFNNYEPVFFLGIYLPGPTSSASLVYFSDCTVIDNDADHTGDFFSNLIDFLKQRLQSISDVLGGIVTGISSLNDTVSNIIRGLGNLLLYFDWEGDKNYKNPFESEGSPVSLIVEHLQNVYSYILDSTNSINSFVDSITGVVSFLDEFVMHNKLPWLSMLVSVSLILIVVTRFIGL